MQNDDPTSRRNFLKGIAAISAVSGLAGPLVAELQPASATQMTGNIAEKFNGIQMGPSTILDEGIEHALDLIQETAGINCVMVYSHTYQGDLRRAQQTQTTDHGVPPRDMRNRKLPSVWIRHDEKYFKNTSLRHQKIDASFEYADRDLLKEALGPCRERGMKLYARILEGSGSWAARCIQGYSKVVTRDVYGRPTDVACWNHPEYRAWWNDTVEDMFRNYDLDGLQWGAERMGPLINVVLPWNDGAPTCFCEFCRARGKEKGIDVERARQGFENLFVYVRGLMTGKLKPADGIFTGFLRILLRYPEILAWEYRYRMAREEVMQGIYHTVKSIKPQAQVGWHVDHEPSSWDIIYRAEMSYAEMAPYSDFIKFIAYQDILGPRIRWWYLDRLQKTILGEVPLEESLDLYYDLFGFDKQKEPKLDQLEKTGFSPEYVYRETKRSVASAEGKTKIYTGIGFDVPWGDTPVPADPEKIYEAVVKSFEAGATGIVVSRDYAEMRVPNLKAVGRAMAEVNRMRESK